MLYLLAADFSWDSPPDSGWFFFLPGGIRTLILRREILSCVRGRAFSPALVIQNRLIVLLLFDVSFFKMIATALVNGWELVHFVFVEFANIPRSLVGDTSRECTRREKVSMTLQNVYFPLFL